MSTARTTSKTNRGSYILALLVFVFFAGGALYYIKLQSNELQKQSTISIIKMQQKNHFVNGMASNIRSRSYTLLSMLNEKDPFVLDKLNQKLFHTAFLFRTNRDALKEIPLTAQQTHTLNELLELTGANSKKQIEVANLLINEHKVQATSLLFDTAIPNQAPMTSLINAFVDLVEQENKLILDELQNRISKNQKITFFISMLLSLFAISLITLLIQLLKDRDLLIAKKTVLNKNLIDSALDAIIVTNDKGTITVFNEGASNLFGYTQTELLNKHINSLLTIDFDYLLILNEKSDFEKNNEGPYLEDAAIHKNLRLLPVLLSIADTGVSGDSRYNLIIRDLTTNKASERFLLEQTRELNEIRARYKKLSETEHLN
ncbi:MAG: PAS domain S-box protein [Cycloclasticus sp.]